MDVANCELACALVGRTYIQQGSQVGEPGNERPCPLEQYLPFINCCHCHGLEQACSDCPSEASFSQALAARRRRIKALLSQRRLPEQGWDDATIEMLLQVRRAVGHSFVAKGQGKVAHQAAGMLRHCS